MSADPQAIARYRAGKGWHQAELARQAGLSRAYISMIEAGEREPSPPALDAIATALGIPLSALIADNNVTCPSCGHEFRVATYTT